MRYVLTCFFVVLLGRSPVDALDGRIHWPPVRPLHESFYFPDPAKAVVETYIRGTDDKPLYYLECYTGGNEGSHGFEYSGLFDCTFTSLGPPRDGRDLLHEDFFVEKGWWSRGRFLTEDLLGDCGTYPEHGTVRHFRLRGMQITLEVNRLQLTATSKDEVRSHEVSSFGFEVDVQPAPDAISAIAAATPFRDPPVQVNASPTEYRPNCKEIVQQHLLGQVTPEYLVRHGLAGHVYPTVRAVQRTIHIRPQTSYFEYSQNGGKSFQDHFGFWILDTTGNQVYEFTCSQYPGGWFTYFVVTCGLFQPSKEINLLEDAVDPYSRLGQNVFFPDQLFKECGSYPDWGAHREFKLRGLDLILEFKDVVFRNDYIFGYDFATDPGLEHAALTIMVRPDASATSPVAQPPRFVFRGFDPEGQQACKNPLTISP
jgi:hypothetical protein